MIPGRTEGEDGLEGQPPLAVLDGARNLTELLVGAFGGSAAEADATAADVVCDVASQWQPLGLARLAAHEALWEAYLQRQICARWLLVLHRRRRHWSVPVPESLARARFLALVERACLFEEDLALAERVLVHRMTVTETAITAGLDVAEVARRLRQLWHLIRAEPLGSSA